MSASDRFIESMRKYGDEYVKGIDFRTVKELKEWLEQFADDAIVYGYEGEMQGIIVEDIDVQGEFHNKLRKRRYNKEYYYLEDKPRGSS